MAVSAQALFAFFVLTAFLKPIEALQSTKKQVQEGESASHLTGLDYSRLVQVQEGWHQYSTIPLEAFYWTLGPRGERDCNLICSEVRGMACDGEGFYYAAHWGEMQMLKKAAGLQCYGTYMYQYYTETAVPYVAPTTTGRNMCYGFVSVGFDSGWGCEQCTTVSPICGANTTSNLPKKMPGGAQRLCPCYPTPAPTPAPTPPTPAPTPSNPDKLNDDQMISTSTWPHQLATPDKTYTLVFEQVGLAMQVALYKQGLRIWSTSTTRKGDGPYSLIMQSDGNLVLYDANWNAMWASGSAGRGSPPYSAILQGDGNFVIYDASHAIWSSKHGLVN